MKKLAIAVRVVALVLTMTSGLCWGQQPLKIGVMPKLIGIDFFNATEVGAKKAGEELGVTVDFDGPVTADVTLQAQIARDLDRQEV